MANNVAKMRNIHVQAMRRGQRDLTQKQRPFVFFEKNLKNDF